MLKKKFRLAKTKFREKARLASDRLIIKITPNLKDYSRFAFVVSKKIDKKATERNRIKRLIRRTIEEKIYKIKKGFDFLIILRKKIESGKELEELLKKAEYIE